MLSRSVRKSSSEFGGALAGDSTRAGKTSVRVALVGDGVTTLLATFMREWELAPEGVLSFMLVPLRDGIRTGAVLRTF